jgi:S-adenosylmethionine uptake transporter
MLLSACLFSIQDIINKRYVHRQSLLEMVFYLAVVAAALLAWGAVRVWVAPQAAQWGLLLGLACGSNLILVCLLRAFKLAEASFYAPFRYTEILASSALGWVVFGEVPSRYTLLGAGIVMLCALYITGVKARAAAAPTTDTEAPAPWPATKLAPSSPRPSGQKK